MLSPLRTAWSLTPALISWARVVASCVPDKCEQGCGCTGVSSLVIPAEFLERGKGRMMASTKKAPGKTEKAAPGGGGGGQAAVVGFSQKKKKKQPNKKKPAKTNKQSIKQRVRAEAAEKSRLLRKAKLAMQKRIQRESTAAAAAAAEEERAGGATALSAPSSFEDGSDYVGPAPPRASPGNASGARRAERREAVHHDVEVKLGQWRKKRAREEAGLPGDGEQQYGPCPAGAGYYEQSDGGGSMQGGTFGRSLLSAGGGGGGEAGDSRVLGGAGGCWRGAANGGGRWPEVFNAPAPRRSMPRPGRAGPFPSAAAATARPGGSGSTGVTSDARARDAETRWVAPWMVGLVDRFPGGAAGPRGRGGRDAGRVGLVGSEEGEAGLLRGASDGGALQSRGRDGSNVDIHGAGSSHGSSVKSPEGATRDGGAEGGGEASGQSDLHHEILRFEDYVSLTPAEVAARENLVSSVQASAREALGSGATARAYGSYGGAGDELCFSIFLSDVDISVRPPADSSTVPPPQGRCKAPARSTLGSFLDLTRGSDDGFEEGSSSSDSSSSSSGSDSDSDSASDGDRAGSNSKPSPGPQSAAASDAASAIYVASSGSESDRPEESPSPNRPQQGGRRPAGQPGRFPEDQARGGTTTGPSSGCNPADTAVPQSDQSTTKSVTSACKAGDDRGGFSVKSSSAPGAEAFGFYIDSRPDPALQKLALRERERAAEGEAPCPSDGLGTEECGDFGRQPVGPPSAAKAAGAAEADTAVGALSARGLAKNLPSTNPSTTEAKPAEAASARAGEEVASSSKRSCAGEAGARAASEVAPSLNPSAGAGAEVSASIERGIGGGGAAEVASSSNPSAAAGAEFALTSKPFGAAGGGYFPIANADLGAGAAAVGERNTMDIRDIGETTAQASSTDPGDPAAPMPAVVPGAVLKTNDETTTPGPSNTSSSSVSPTRQEKGLFLSPSPRPPESRLASEDDVGSGGGKRGLLEAGESQGSRVTEEVEGGRNRAVLSPDGGSRSGKGKKKVEGEHGREGKEGEEGKEEEVEEEEGDEEVGKKELEEEEEENESGSRAGNMPPTRHVGDGERPAAKVASASSADSAVVDAATSAIVSDSEVASAAVQLVADRIRAESERTVRLRAIAASLAAELWHTGESGTSSGGAIGPRNPVQAVAAVGQGNQEDEDGDGDGVPKDPEEARYSEGPMALVREQEKRNRGGSLPVAFVSNPGGGGGPTASQNSRESLRAAKLQAALTASAEAAAKRRRSGIAVPPEGVLKIHARPGLAGKRGGWGSGRAPWRGGRAGGKARAVSGKHLLKKRWVEKFEFRSRAKVPIIAMLDARGGVDCDVSWAGDGGGGDCWEDPTEAPGPAYFAKMFPGTFRPLALILKVFMRQRGLDKPFTGGVGSFKLYALIASHLQACGCGRAQQQPRDLGQLLLGFFRRYSYTSKERLAPTTVLRVKDLTVDLGSAYRAMAASKDFARAAQALSLAIAEEASSSKNGGLSAEGKGTATCRNRNPKRPKMNHSDSKTANLTPPAQAAVPVEGTGGGGTTEGNEAARDAQQSTSVTTGLGRSKRFTSMAATGVGLHDDGRFVLDDDRRHVGLSGSLSSNNWPLGGFASAAGVGDGGETSGCGGAHGNADLDYDQPRDGEVDASGSRQHGQPSFRDGASEDGSIRGSDHHRDGTKDRSESQLRNGSSEPRSESQHEQVEHAAQFIRRRSILGRVIWGSDLRRERESRLVAVGSAKASPRPAGPEPSWHVKLETSSHPGGEGQPNGQPLETCPGAKPRWGHGSNSGGLFEASSDAKGRGSGGGGSSGGSSVQQQKQQTQKKKPKAKKNVDKVQKKKMTMKKAAKKNVKKTVKKTTKKMKEGKRGNSSNAPSHNSSNGSTKKRKRASSDQATRGSTKQQPKKAKSKAKKDAATRGID
ncbi:unnamed protein product [Ectocarpus sp. CCAP 1310/34]|nr:unnamed protein product [Ectocarpus sp. CCAP 1310/34]